MLAGAANYFETIFYGANAEKEEEEVTLVDVDANGFREFLDVARSSEIQIDGKRPSRRYVIVTERYGHRVVSCNRFLSSQSKVSPHKSSPSGAAHQPFSQSLTFNDPISFPHLHDLSLMKIVLA